MLSMRNIALLMLCIAVIQLMVGHYFHRQALKECAEDAAQLFEYASMLEKENARLNELVAETCEENR